MKFWERLFGKKEVVEKEPDYSHIEAPIKYMIVPTDVHCFWVYSIWKKDFAAYVKKHGKEPTLDLWYQHTFHYEKEYAVAWVKSAIESDKKQLYRQHARIAFQRDNPPILFE